MKNPWKPLTIIAVIFFGLAQIADAQETQCAFDDNEDLRQQAEQKVVLLERLSGQTEPTRRVLESGDTDAAMLLRAARDSASMARQSLEAGCIAHAAELATTGLEQASIAFRLVRNQDVGREREYKVLHRQTAGLMEILESRATDELGISEDDFAGIKRQRDRAEILAIDGKYDEASALLEPVADRLQRRLIAIFDQQTIYYERDFDGPEDEYAYTVEQFNGYLLLLQQIASERQPPFSSRQNYEKAMQDAASLNKEARQLAATKDWQSSLAAMHEALKKCETALRLTGVTY